MYNIDWNALLNMLLPLRWRNTTMKEWLQACTSGLKDTYDAFIAYKAYFDNRQLFSAHKLYLEKFLNDNFNPSSTPGYYPIIIENKTIPRRVFFRRKAELQPVYFYKKWDAVTVFSINQYCVGADSILYSCILSAFNKPVSNATYWTPVREIDYWYQKAEYSTFVNYIVKVPTYITLTDLQVLQLQEKIDQYNVAGMNYVIQNY